MSRYHLWCNVFSFKKINFGTISGVKWKTLVLVNGCVKFSPKSMKTNDIWYVISQNISFVMVSGSDFENHWFFVRFFTGEVRTQNEPQEPQALG